MSSGEASSVPYSHRRPADYASLTRHLLRLANQGVSRISYLRLVSERLLEFADADGLILKLNDGALHYCWHAGSAVAGAPEFRRLTGVAAPPVDGPTVESVCRSVLQGRRAGAALHARRRVLER